MAGRSYPHLTQIRDPMARDSLRLLWDKFFGLEQLVTQTQSDITAQQTAMTSLQADTASAKSAAKLALSKLITTQTPSGTTSGGGGTVDDGGQGALGCAQAGSDGHVPAGSTLDLVTAGKVICGVGKEFPSLLAIAANQPTRDANQDQLLFRMCWHMGLAGYACGRYGTAAGRPWILLFNLGTTQYAYRVVDYAAGDFTIPYTTTMVFSGQSPNTATTPDPGISD